MSDLKVRTREFAWSIVRLYVRLPNTTEAQVLGKQRLRSGTSVGAQYREAQRAKSRPDFIIKIEGSLQEAEETLYWLELLHGVELISKTELNIFSNELEQLISIFVSMVRKVKQQPR